ncbi:MAG TPA: DUF998 domain-containing protein [Candidatus Nitrosotalea sp.]|nr:DUF998 domain-containing protein [Candidatus Nitrosotalea sp.]
MATVRNHPIATDGAARPWLALGAVAGPALFTLGWFVLGFISPGYTMWGVHVAPYSPISQPLSGLGLGPTAPFMNAAFILSGLLMVAGAVGVFRAIPELSPIARGTCTLLLAIPGLGAVIDGIFTLETIFFHAIGFGLALTTVVGFPVIGLFLRRVPSWRRFGTWLLLGGPLTLALAVLYFATFTPTVEGSMHGIAGLTERVLVLELDAWYVALGWLAFRRSSLDVRLQKAV